MADSQSTPEVEYRQIEGFPGYRIGNDGSVWSAWAYNGHQSRRLSSDWKRLRPSPDGDGYLGLNLFRDGKPHRRKVHLLVIHAFVGPRPSRELQACHENGIVSDCRAFNLRWDTPVANQRDRVKHGTSPRGNGNGQARLTEEQVKEIRQCIADGEMKKTIARRFGVAASTICAIARGKNWAWLEQT